ncbi:MAG: NAD(P)-dependent alcohol dehydrogenase [Candidatus Marinimicrobia bacterium]|nr:NAD(P)-dependent alcohol dehydrogenase [Candidatus Neomarinimicrobiota bacterium]MCF7827889.1 NAD(P)-dependent alcohol dehydrogenase [Candidatus Neomarinimicrobiota bacterium]MCF7879356.1 NAD(P)-dependent alcohol dehydrogenase [Candidatus Neomarinimicrobiota bacterium]
MKAITYAKYGSPDVCKIREVETPVPESNEVLVRVHEAPLTNADMAFRKGKPFIARFFSGLIRPQKLPGGELAGIIEAVGKDVTKFTPGDRVFGSTDINFGAHAEYKCLPEDGMLVKMPSTLSFGETAGICDGGFTALYFLRNKANIQSGQKILINGASGAVGTYAVQLARYFGAEVTGVCSTTNIELAESLGAHQVIDYTRENFTESDQTYDIVFDAVGKSSFSECKKVLTKDGLYLTTVPSAAIFLQMAWTSVGKGKQAIFAASGLNQDREDLLFLRELLASGELRAVVDRRYPMEQIVEAHRYVDEGHKKGNVVITVRKAE